jgi:transposase-like protein
LVEAALPAIHLRRVHHILPADLFQRHPSLPLLQHRQFLLTAPLPPSTTPILDRFHHGVHLALLAYDTCPSIKWGTTVLSGTVEADKTLIGGKAKKRAGRVRLEVANHADEETIRIFLEKNLKPGSKVHTDGWRGYSDRALLDYRHIVKVRDSPQNASRVAPHIRRVFSNLKTWLLGTHHGVELKYLQAYLDEFVFRFNRRQTPMAAFQTLLASAPPKAINL